MLTFALSLLLLIVIAALGLIARREHSAAAIAAADLANTRAQLWQARRDAKTAIERLHAVSDSALRGCPAVKWTRGQPLAPGADAWYWRVRVAGEELLLTDEQFRAARQRADHLLSAGREVTTSAVAKSETPAGGPS